MVTHVANKVEWMAFCQRRVARGWHQDVGQVQSCPCCRESFVARRFALPPGGIAWDARGFVLSTTAALLGVV